MKNLIHVCFDFQVELRSNFFLWFNWCEYIYYEGQFFNLLCIYLDICLHLSVVLNNQRLNIKARIYLIMEWLIHVLECISLQYYKDSDVKYLHAFIDWLECGDCITSISQIIKPCLGCFSSICPGSFALILMGYSQQTTNHLHCVWSSGRNCLHIRIEFINCKFSC